jgi:hypothetical protein
MMTLPVATGVFGDHAGLLAILSYLSVAGVSVIPAWLPRGIPSLRSD